MEVGRVCVEGCVEYVAGVQWLEVGVEEEYIASLTVVLNTKCVESGKNCVRNMQSLGDCSS